MFPPNESLREASTPSLTLNAALFFWPAPWAAVRHPGQHPSLCSPLAGPDTPSWGSCSDVVALHWPLATGGHSLQDCAHSFRLLLRIFLSYGGPSLHVSVSFRPRVGSEHCCGEGARACMTGKLRGPGPQPLDLAFEGLQAHRVDGADGPSPTAMGRPVQRQWCQRRGHTGRGRQGWQRARARGQLHVGCVTVSKLANLSVLSFLLVEVEMMASLEGLAVCLRQWGVNEEVWFDR